MTRHRRRHPCETALGVLVLVVPPWPGDAVWVVAAFNRRGEVECRSRYATEADAKKRQAELFRLHRKLAAEREARRRK